MSTGAGQFGQAYLNGWKDSYKPWFDEEWTFWNRFFLWNWKDMKAIIVSNTDSVISQTVVSLDSSDSCYIVMCPCVTH